MSWTTPGMEDVQFSLMAPSTRRTSQVADFINRVIRENRLAARVEITTNQRDALQNAQFVIATLQIGGNDAYALDIDIPLRYGVDQWHRRLDGTRRHFPGGPHHPGDGRAGP
jgi:alpha-galactosidase